jgi:hypothetical protein
MRPVFCFLILLPGMFFARPAHCQHPDTLIVKPAADTILPKITDSSRLPAKDSSLGSSASDLRIAPDSSTRKKHNPRRATIYSAILPGAGQVYNGKFWKVPIVYAAIGIPAYFYFDNKKWYNKCQYALTVTVNGSQGDSLAKVDPLLRVFVDRGDVNGIITNRDSFRKNEDYSVLFFLLFYGLNIVDATVDAHLRDFNVNSDLSFRVKPMMMISPAPAAGLSLVFDLHKGRSRPLSLN